MPKTLSPIPAGVSIVDRDGAINDFFRLRWQELIDGFLYTPTVAAVFNDPATPDPNAAIVTTVIYTTKTSGRYRLSYRFRKTVADGVNSSLTLTIGWVEGGIAQTKTFAALLVDTILAEQDGVLPLRCDSAIDVTLAFAYVSNTPGLMHYNYDLWLEQAA